MAERVSQRLGKGAHRFSNIRNSHNRAATSKCHGGCLLLTNGTTTTSTRTVPHRPAAISDLPQVSSTTTTTTTSEEAEYRTRVGSVQGKDALLNVCDSVSATSLESLSLDPGANSSILPHREDMQKTLYRSPAAVQPQLQMRLIGRVTLTGNKRSVVMAATLHPDIFRSCQQLRGFSTLILKVALSDQWSGFGLSVNGLSLKELKHLTDSLQPSTSTRFYSWSTNHSKSDVPPLYRSKTAYYDILRVTPNATQSQIKTAYYKQSLIYHPDKNQGSEEATRRFSEISEAYCVLGNKTLRRKYDCGIMSRSDVQGDGRPSSRETSKPSGSQQQQQHGGRRFSQAHDGRPIYDYDAWLRAHYGEQLQRERWQKARREQMRQQQEDSLRKWKQGTKIYVVGMLLAMAGIGILISDTRS